MIEKGAECDEVFAKPPPLQSISMGINSRFEEDLGDDSKLVDQYLSSNHESTRISQLNGHVGTNHAKTSNDLTLTGTSFNSIIIIFISFR